MSGHQEPGPLAAEAARLVEAGLEWAQRLAASVDPTGERLATGAPECGVCPVCRAMSALRDPSPEMAERLTSAVTELATLVAAGLRAFEGHVGPAGQREHSGGGDPATAWRPASRPRRRGSGVEHIDIA